MKSEARISKSETNSNPEGPKFKTCFENSDLEFQICFAFRASNFEFNNHFKTYKSKIKK